MVGFAYKNIRETHKTTFCCYLSRRLAVGQRGGGAENSAPGCSIGKWMKAKFVSNRDRRTSVTGDAARAPALSHMYARENSNVARIMQFLFIKSADFGDNSVDVCKRHCFISVSSGRSASSAFEIYLNNWMMHTFGLSRICFGLRREVEAREINKGIVMHHS